jgi:hypothetical protein
MVADLSPVGRIGVLLVATRGAGGPGEVQLKIRGGTEAFLAYSDEPLPKGTTVLAVQERGARKVDVVPWSQPPTVS